MRELKRFGPSLAKPKIKAAKEKCEHWPPPKTALFQEARSQQAGSLPAVV